MHLISKSFFHHKGGSRTTTQSRVATYSLLDPDFSNILKLIKYRTQPLQLINIIILEKYLKNILISLEQVLILLSLIRYKYIL